MFPVSAGFAGGSGLQITADGEDVDQARQERERLAGCGMAVMLRERPRWLAVRMDDVSSIWLGWFRVCTVVDAASAVDDGLLSVRPQVDSAGWRSRPRRAGDCDLGSLDAGDGDRGVLYCVHPPYIL